MVTLSIVIPFYNEAEGIPSLNRQLCPVLGVLENQFDIELILVDDGSTDDTYLLLKANFAYLPKVKFLRHAVNRNLGGALQTGFHAASGDLVCCMDSDCSYEPGLLIDMIQFLQQENLDIVTASPYHPKGEVLDISRQRLLLSKSLSVLYRMILPFKLYCFTSIFRVYKKNTIESIEIQSTGFLAVTEILIKAGFQGCRLGEVPARLTSRNHGVSKAKIGNMITDHLCFITRILLTRLFPSRLKVLVPGHTMLFLH